MPSATRVELQRGDCGKMRVRRDLEGRGIERDVVAEELAREFNDERENELAARLAMKKLGRLGNGPASEAKRKVYAYLVRRGFTSEAASQAARHAVEQAGRTDESDI